MDAASLGELLSRGAEVRFARAVPRTLIFAIALVSSRVLESTGESSWGGACDGAGSTAAVVPGKGYSPPSLGAAEVGDTGAEGDTGGASCSAEGWEVDGARVRGRTGWDQWGVGGSADACGAIAMACMSTGAPGVVFR